MLKGIYKLEFHASFLRFTAKYTSALKSPGLTDYEYSMNPTSPLVFIKKIELNQVISNVPLGQNTAYFRDFQKQWAQLKD